MTQSLVLGHTGGTVVSSLLLIGLETFKISQSISKVRQNRVGGGRRRGGRGEERRREGGRGGGWGALAMTVVWANKDIYSLWRK